MTTEQKIALITGANKGIGFETARQLGGQGMVVLIGARDDARGQAAAATLRGEGIDAHAVRLDVTEDTSVQEAAKWIDAEYGRLDVLVNNAGAPTISRQRSTPSTTDLDDMRAVYEINVFGVVRVTNAMLPLLRQAPAARIVNVSSEVGSISSQTDPASPLSQMPASAQYPSSKAAVNMITAMYAKELKDTPIKVNAANPGYCATDFNNNSGFRTAAQGAESSVYLATLPDDGPSGIHWGHLWTTEGDGGYGVIGWLSVSAPISAPGSVPISAPAPTPSRFRLRLRLRLRRTHRARRRGPPRTRPPAADHRSPAG